MERSRKSLCFLLVLLVLVSVTTSSELPLLPPLNSRSPLVAVAAPAPNQVELLMIRLIRTFFGDQLVRPHFHFRCGVLGFVNSVEARLLCRECSVRLGYGVSLDENASYLLGYCDLATVLCKSDLVSFKVLVSVFFQLVK